MEQILTNIVEEYNKLLELYEEMNDNFISADYGNVDECVTRMGENIKYMEPISDSQKRIADLRMELKKDISSDILIDSLVDDFSGGRIGIINERIGNIIQSIQSYEIKSKALLEQEMEKLEGSLEDIGIGDILKN